MPIPTTNVCSDCPPDGYITDRTRCGPRSGCIICANGNDLPDGEYCRACGRDGLATGLRAAVIRARGRSEPPKGPITFALSNGERS